MENLKLSASAAKADQQKDLLPQLRGLIAGETDLVANCANVSAVLKEQFDYFWVGFYFVKQDQLVLGPFQGPLACTRILKGKGVCGTAWAEKKSQLVPDVHAFSGHIACNPNSKSEVVVPVFKGDEVVAVLDVDSNKLDDFTPQDVEFLEQVAACVGPLF